MLKIFKEYPQESTIFDSQPNDIKYMFPNNQNGENNQNFNFGGNMGNNTIGNAIPNINNNMAGNMGSITGNMNSLGNNMGLDEDILYYRQLLTEAMQMFQQQFGFVSESFIATTYEWSPKIEPCLVDLGVRFIQGTVCQKIPLDNDMTVKYSRRCFQGSRSKSGLVRLMRNCFFEPSTKPNFDFIDDCLRRIELAFKWGKAANICSHRVNYIGSIDKSNTDRNLPLLKQLLTTIVAKWPDVEFITSDQLGHIITKGKYQ